jgi:outer membrane protein assembly factor BamB
VLTLGILTGGAAADDSVTRTGSNITVEDSVVESDRPDPPADTLGWEHGVWANATLSIDQSDGINRTELEAVVARTMARVETVREIEFDRTPPVRVIFQQQQRNESAERSYSEANRTLLNTQYEALFLINESRDAVDSRRALLGGGVNGYYSPDTRNVTLVSPNASVLQIREGILAQELFHAQQDNQFSLPSVETIEERNTRNSYVEGDANYVQYLYEQRCAGAWNGTCYRPDRSAAPDLSGLNDGMRRLFQQPYESGYAFVRDRQQRQGWEAVNALYEDPPASTEQVIHPELYGQDEPTNLTVNDQSTGAWQPLRAGGTRVTGSVGEPGLYISMVYPALETNGQRDIVPLQNHFVGGFGSQVQLRYDHPVTAGWDGDQLVPYVTSSGNKTGYVYESVWDSAADAREFQRAYRKLLAYHNAKPVDGRANTYRVPPNDGFTDAFYIERSDKRLRIVNAPTVDALSAISQGAAPQADESSPGPVPPWQRVERTWQTELTDRVVAASSVTDDRVYLAEFDGTIQAVNVTTGDGVWSRAVNETVTAAPVVSNGTVYVGTVASSVVAIDEATGEVDWRQGVNGSIIATPTIANGTVYTGTSQSTLVSLDAVTGKQQWTQQTSAPVGTPLAVTADRVYIASQSTVSAFDRPTGERAWNVTVNGSVLTEPTIADETLYTTSFDRQAGMSRIHAINADNGDARWTQSTNRTLLTVLTVTGDAVYAGGGGLTGTSGGVSAYDRQRGDRRWRLDLNKSVTVDPAVANGTVYVGSTAGQVYAIEAESGDTQFRSRIDGAVSGHVVSNNTLYVGSQGGLLYAQNAVSGDRKWTFVADELVQTTPLVSDQGIFARAGTTLYGLETVSQRDDGTSEGDNTPHSGTETTPTPRSTDSRPGTDATPRNDDVATTDDEGPGFGIVAVGIGFVLVALLLVSKSRR